MPGLTDEQKKKEAARKAQQAAAEKERKNAEKAAKQKKREDEAKRKSAANDKTKPALTGFAAILAQEAAAAEAEAAMSRRQKKQEDLLAADTRGAANGQGDELIFEKKLSKEEKKAAAAARREEKKLMGGGSKKGSSNSLASLASEGGSSSGDLASLAADLSLGPDSTAAGGAGEEAEVGGGSGSGGGSGGGGSKKKDKAGLALARVAKEKAAVEAELEAARVESSRSRTKLGSYKGTLEASAFTLANPGGGANLLEDAACTLERGRRYGLIGRNGKGKSTMLRALAARRVGAVPPNVVVHYVSQEVQLTEATRHLTPAQVVVAGDIERRLLLEECAELEALADEEQLDSQGQERLGEVYEGLENIESDTAERRADELLINLGFSDALRARPLEALSGGWRVRTMLACAVFARPDLLLLDEPTNHLSITAVMWLARELSTSPIWKERIVVVVSHDRAFLDEVCGDVLHISGAARRLTQSHGNYSTWSKRRSEQQATYAKEALLREKEVERMKEFAGHGFKYGGSSSAINKMKMLDKQASKLEVEAADQALELAALQEDMELPLSLKSGGLLPGFVVQLKDVGFGYPGAELLFTGAEFGLTSQSRVVLLGENGNGKTTLVKLMLGELLPTSGEVLIKSGCRVALVNQHHADQIDLSLSPLQYMMQLYKAPEGTSAFDHLQRLRSHLAGCGVTGGSGSTAPVQGAVGEAPSLNLQTTPCAALSGGQRSRVALAAVSFREPHLLVLDEPTNNLDLESVAALAESVRNFQGAVVCVSHDQFFVNAIATEAWVVGGASKQVRRVESFAAYRAVQLKRLLSNAQAAAVSGTNSSSISSSSSSSSKSKASAAGPKPKRVQATTTKPKGQGPAKSTSRDAF